MVWTNLCGFYTDIKMKPQVTVELELHVDIHVHLGRRWQELGGVEHVGHHKQVI